jgi:myo-inositol catabolism protein IolS
MVYMKLGRTEIKVSRITFGCWELGGGMWEKAADEVNIKTIQTAFENGITTFDTAESYGKGHSEQVTGMALQGKRQECVIATKVSKEHLKPADLRRSIEKSLELLQTDYIDIYYIHKPNPLIPLEETISEMDKLKAEGIIRAIGVSNFSFTQLQEALTYAQIDVIQPEYSLLKRDIEMEILPYCLKNSIAVMSFSSIAKGILSGAFHLGQAKMKEGDFRRTRRLFLPEHLEKETELILLLKEIADAKKATLSQIAINWSLCQKGLTSAIVGTQSEKHLMENIQASGIELSPAELSVLDRVSQKVISSL